MRYGLNIVLMRLLGCEKKKKALTLHAIYHLMVRLTMKKSLGCLNFKLIGNSEVKPMSITSKNGRRKKEIHTCYLSAE